MRVKLFTLRFSSTLGGFDETPLHDFVRDKELLQFREHFFSVSDVPHLACVLLWQDALVDPHDLATARELRIEAAAAAEARANIVVPAETFAGTRASRGPTQRRQRGAATPDPTAGLSEPERLLFNSLREWRSAKAREEGVPPYLIFTNRHLLAIVGKRPESPTALGHLTGIGPGKVERYGAEMLAVLHGARPPGEAVVAETLATEAAP